MAAPMGCLEPVEGEGSTGSRASGVELSLPSDPAAPAPMCPHGPTLLFVKVNQGKEETRKFYACSACRDRKDCNFFQWEDEKLSEARLAAREAHNQRYQPPLSRAQCIERYLSFIQLPLTQRKFCRSCQQLLLPVDWGEHGEHQLLSDISITQLRRPSQLLYPLENKKTHAQYLFTDRSCQFLAGLLAALGFRRVLCVGTPRLHEHIRLTAPGEKSNTKSLLLDIDFRYSQFYLEDSFCRYNMFNHHFFDGKAALEVCKAFLQEEEGEGVIMVTDPPFGGLVEPLAITFKKLIAMWKEGQSQDDSYKELPIFWIFPYFFESRICQCFPSFRMLDYQGQGSFHGLLDFIPFILRQRLHIPEKCTPRLFCILNWCPQPVEEVTYTLQSRVILIKIIAQREIGIGGPWVQVDQVVHGSLHFGGVILMNLGGRD
ncbi:rRNA N6-adenosine-methyltransferase ZCCHC4 isoform X2 [Arvicola amphibius]|uniref:rRNA N6-adenosine-methyltransferase ZCCHC4 isoform X2 n=1 Tax=Arvicola amphibius TaxID=1047088 RepID=UPI0018E2AF94|nr:rRNA N6-adenosine-methyltransferase ZCCHC4 isoform X2 [Arvicola amphibius]